MEEIYQQIQNGTEIRENLIRLRQQLKEPGMTQVLKESLQGDYSGFTKLLVHEDPKVRKNAALILGELGDHLLVPALYQAYEAETTMFVRSEYLKALQKLDFSEYQEKLEERQNLLAKQQPSREEEKHYRQEMAQLQKMLLKQQKRKKPVFTGWNQRYDIILTTNRNHREVTARQMGNQKLTLIPLGVKVQEADLTILERIRTFREVLFPLSCKTLPAEPREAAHILAQSDLLRIVTKAHGTQEAFYFRMSIPGKMSLEQRSDFIKKCSFGLEQGSGRRLRNTASDYEIEIRLLERRDHTFLPLLKLYTLPDERFSYRRESIAASIHPSKAALIVQLAKPYLKEKAQVLDPFCGVGTMLIERNQAVSAGPMYGLDIFGEAVRKARENTSHTEKEVYYINRDFFDFSHEYLFDEIITDLPWRGKKTREEQGLFYERFFHKALEVLKPEGTMVLYSNEKGHIKKQIRLNENLKLLNEYEINEKEEFSVYVIGRRD